MANKGSPYERDICDLLSEWWTGNKKTRVFWRTSNSGGTATVKEMTGGTHRGHAGDVCALVADAEPFVSLITLELKRGYNKSASIHNLLDKGPKQNKTKLPGMFEQWILQARRAAMRAKTPHWAIIHRRDNYQSMIFFPSQLYAELVLIRAIETLPIPFLTMTVRVRDSNKPVPIVGMRLDRFLGLVDRADILHLIDLRREIDEQETGGDAGTPERVRHPPPREGSHARRR